LDVHGITLTVADRARLPIIGGKYGPPPYFGYQFIRFDAHSLNASFERQSPRDARAVHPGLTRPDTLEIIDVGTVAVYSATRIDGLPGAES
jgi:hypothetical protein